MNNRSCYLTDNASTEETHWTGNWDGWTVPALTSTYLWYYDAR